MDRTVRKRKKDISPSGWSGWSGWTVRSEKERKREALVDGINKDTTWPRSDLARSWSVWREAVCPKRCSLTSIRSCSCSPRPMTGSCDSDRLAKVLPNWSPARPPLVLPRRTTGQTGAEWIFSRCCWWRLSSSLPANNAGLVETSEEAAPDFWPWFEGQESPMLTTMSCSLLTGSNALIDVVSSRNLLSCELCDVG